MIELLIHASLTIITILAAVLIFGGWGAIISFIAIFVVLIIMNIRSVNE
jgi:hypothetical protein